MNGKLYSTLPNTIIGFHGCDISTFNEVIMNQSELKASTNKYDWLGSGIYFWEHNLKRAYQWAEDAARRPNSKKNSCSYRCSYRLGILLKFNGQRVY